LYLYVFAAVAGCLLVLVSLLGAGQSDDHSGDAGEGQGDAHGDGEAASHADAGAADGHMVGHDGGTAAAHGDGHDGGHGAAHAAHDAMGVGAGHHSGSDGLDSGVPTALLWLMSIQLWTYLLAFGGLTGLLLRTVAKVGEPVAGLSALGVGLFTAFSARAVMRKMSVTTESGTLQEERMVGSRATVLIPAPAGGVGKIRLEVSGQTIDLIARPSDGGPLAEGIDVTIIDIRDGQAEVSVTRAEGSAAQPVNRGAAAASRSTQEKG
jgi:membrane protein implicated in regulation of membrane protease activity